MTFPDYTFFPHMDHTGDGVSSMPTSCKSVAYNELVIEKLLRAITPATRYLAGFTLNNIANGKSQACVKTTAIGTSVQPVLNRSAANVSFAGPCDGAYVLIPFNRKWRLWFLGVFETWVDLSLETSQKMLDRS